MNETVIPGEPLIRWDWVLRNLDQILYRIGEHLVLTGLAVGIGFALSFVLALFALRIPRLLGPITWTTGVMYTIPSLALFAMLVPFSGLTIVTAEVGLVSYTLLILVRSIVLGVLGVPSEVREAATGMGYTPRQLFWEVELPLAVVEIIAGLRIATVTTVGLTAVSALIGQGGLGRFIVDGLVRLFSTQLIIGAVLSIVLAVLLDSALSMIQRRLTPWQQVG